MDQAQRMQLIKQGFIVLRPMLDSRKNLWKITKQSFNGGWKRFGCTWFYDKNEAQKAINGLVAEYPKQYRSDE